MENEQHEHSQGDIVDVEEDEGKGTVELKQADLNEVRSTMRQKVREWIMRYLPLEVAGTSTALLGGMAAHYLSGGNEIAAAVAGAWCENVGFYGTAALRELFHYRAKHKEDKRWWRYPLIFFKSVRNLIAEFGLAEAFDTVLIRPAFMYAFQKLSGNAPLGILAGKVAADVIFYGIAVTAYEIRKIFLKD